MNREMIQDKVRIGKDNVILASVTLCQSSAPIYESDITNVTEQALRQAGISCEWIDVTSITLSPAIPPSFVKTVRNQYQNVFTCDNLVYAICNIQRKLLETDSHECFGLIIIVELSTHSDTITIGAMVFKRPDYIALTDYLQEGVVCLVLNSNCTNIVTTTISSINKELYEREEPLLCQEDIEIVFAGKNDADGIAKFFRALLFNDHLSMLVIKQGKTQSAILIQT